MLFKLKSVLYPPDATAINRRRYKITRFFLAVAYEHCINMKHFWFGEKIETSLNLFPLVISKRLSFRDLHLGVMKTQTPGNTTESQESYLTTGMLPYKHSSFFPPTHGSIMLLPCQPCVFARLARWQKLLYMGFRTTLNFWNFKVALNSMYRIF